MIKEIENNVPWAFIISNLNDEKTVGIFVLSKKTVYGKLVVIVNAIDTKIPTISRLVSKTHFGLDT